VKDLVNLQEYYTTFATSRHHNFPVFKNNRLQKKIPK
jgi:hypothetical protein